MFTVSDAAETHLVFCKETANERKESLLLISRMQLIFCKDTAKCEQNKIKSFIFLKSIRFDCAAMSVIRLVCIYMEQVFRYHQLMTMLQYLWKVFVFLLSRFLTGFKNKKSPESYCNRHSGHSLVAEAGFSLIHLPDYYSESSIHWSLYCHLLIVLIMSNFIQQNINLICQCLV